MSNIPIEREILRRSRRGGLAALAIATALGCAGATTAAAEKQRYPGMVGEIGAYVATADDTLLDIARRFGLGFTELVAANPGVDAWLPGAGKKLILPSAHLVPDAPREGIVLNLADQRLYIFRARSKTVESIPIGVGRDAWNTPIGQTKVVRKRANPDWHPPKSIRAEDPTLPRVVRAGPNNPLGQFAIYLGWSGYLIHGTNKPMGVGRRVSHGCVRLYPEHIKRYFRSIAIGTRVTVVDQPIKIGWVDGVLMLEAHPSQAQADDMEAGEKIAHETPAEFEYRILDAAAENARQLDWPKIRRTLRARRGIPVNILKQESAAIES